MDDEYEREFEQYRREEVARGRAHDVIVSAVRSGLLGDRFAGLWQDGNRIVLAVTEDAQAATDALYRLCPQAEVAVVRLRHSYAELEQLIDEVVDAAGRLGAIWSTAAVNESDNLVEVMLVDLTLPASRRLITEFAARPVAWSEGSVRLVDSAASSGTPKNEPRQVGPELTRLSVDVDRQPGPDGLTPLQAGAWMRGAIEDREVTLQLSYDDGIGVGADARAAWEAFKEMAALPVYEPFVDWSGEQKRVDPSVGGDSLLMEAGVAQPWWEKTRSGRRPDPPRPDVFQLSFRRQFSFIGADGEHAGMDRVLLVVEFALTEDLRALAGVPLWGDGGPPREDEQLRRSGEPPENALLPGAALWCDEVEASAAFRTAFDHGVAEAFHFNQSPI